MEGIKKQYFDRLINQKGEETKIRCFQAMRMIENEAGDWYGTYVDASIDSETFVQMMVVDGCFIIELLCKEPQDKFATLHWSRLALFGDLLLLENQLPFFVLVKLFNLINDPTHGTDFAPLAFAKLIEVLPGPGIGTHVTPSSINDNDAIDHLLGLVHNNLVPSPQGINRHRKYVFTFLSAMKRQVERQSMGCARELEEAGIGFIKVDESNAMRLFDGSTYVIDYVILMDNLINTANDEIFDNVKQHCAKPWNVWKAKLRHDYFSTPWSGIAFFVALLVALATVGQFITPFLKKN
ncbi:hypothetical protein PTKIN_Ptkin14bG0229900 [Pterospermum kingtungense]